jgi:hypothetical protein
MPLQSNSSDELDDPPMRDPGCSHNSCEVNVIITIFLNSALFLLGSANQSNILIILKFHALREKQEKREKYPVSRSTDERGNTLKRGY